MLRRFSINFALLSMTLDGLSVIFGLWLATRLRPALNGLPGVEFISPLVTTPAPLFYLFPLLWILIYSLLSIYDGRKYLRVADEFSGLSLAMVIASVSAAGVLYFSYRDVSRFLFALSILFIYLLGLLWRALVRLYFRSQILSTESTRRVLVVGAGTLGQKVRDQMTAAASSSDFAFIGFVDHSFDSNSDLPATLGTPDQICDVVLDLSISDIVIALPHSEYHQMGEIVHNLEKLPVQVWVALGFFDLALYRTSIEDLAGIPMLDLRASAIDDYQRMMKRAFDIFFGLFALIAGLPFMALSALMIFLEDGSPVIFRQKRAGENGRLFDMLKFRTMVKNAEQLQDRVEKRDLNGNIIYKTRDDPRVTRVGRFLRRYSLDELPQFINIVRGDMSLVGPRPELPQLVEKYLPWQRKRFAVPPGLTGWWQISGRSDKPMHLHTEDDLYYIQNYSIWLDLQILVRTVWVVLIGKGSY